MHTFDFGQLGRIQVPIEARLSLEFHRLQRRVVGTYTLAEAITAESATLIVREALPAPKDVMGRVRDRFSVIIGGEEVATVTAIETQNAENGHTWRRLTVTRGTEAESIIPARRTPREWPAGTAVEVLMYLDRLDPLREGIFSTFTEILTAQIEPVLRAEMQQRLAAALNSIQEIK